VPLGKSVVVDERSEMALSFPSEMIEVAYNARSMALLEPLSTLAVLLVTVKD